MTENKVMVFKETILTIAHLGEIDADGLREVCSFCLMPPGVYAIYVRAGCKERPYDT